MTEPVIRIVQITDLHITTTPKKTPIEENPRESLERVLQAIQNLTPYPDVLIASGDLADDGAPESYQILRDLLLKLDLPVHCAQGNHDLPENLERVLVDHPISNLGEFDYGNWQLLLLDSCVPEESYGNVAPSELNRISEALTQKPDHNTLIVLHHSPIAVCSARGCNLENAQELLSLLQSHPKVRGVAWGHIHQEYDAIQENLRLMGTPSTCSYFEHSHSDGSFEVTHSKDTDRIGFRLMELYPDGTIQTEVVWG